MTDQTPAFIAPDADAFDAEIRRRDLLGYWMIGERSNTDREPKPAYRPRLWHWDDLEQMAYGAVNRVSKAESYRRFVGFQNPDLKLGTTPNYLVGCQLLLPGESAPAHRHTMDAVRYIVRGGAKAYTVMDGECFTMQDRDFITTPNFAWHDHNNEGERDVIWIDGAVSPLVRGLGVGFAQMYSAERQELAGGGGSGPYDARAARKPIRFPWAETEKALAALSRDTPDPADDCVYRFVDPAHGGATLPTLDCAMTAMRAGWRGVRHRHVHATTLHVVEGAGVTEIGGVDFAWKQGDTFVVPLWTWHRHMCDQRALLFSIDDSAVLNPLGLNRLQVE